MAIPASIFHNSEEQHPVSTLNQHLRYSELPGPPLLALHTDAGTVYACPSRWQRLRLQWIFRHFHVLPLQLLSRRDRRLIEKLSQSAVDNPAQPVAGFTLLGVVENLPRKAPLYGKRLVMMRTEVAAIPAAAARARLDLSQPVQQKQGRDQSAKVATSPRTMRARLSQWGALAAPATVGLVLILLSLNGKPLPQNTVAVSQRETTATTVVHAANHVKLSAPQSAVPALLVALPAIAPVANTEKPKHVVAPRPPAPVRTAAFATVPVALPAPVATPATAAATIPGTVPIVPAASSAPRYVSELPPGHFAHPVVANRNLVGELQLQALIGADGSVKKITVLSGSPALAEVGMRAVRQWHYSPYEVLGSPVEVETHIRMSFFGEDAVSIASVANGTASQPK